MIGISVGNARDAARVCCCALGSNVNKHVHGRSEHLLHASQPLPPAAQRKQCNAAARAIMQHQRVVCCLPEMKPSTSIHPPNRPTSTHRRGQAGSHAAMQPARLGGSLARHAAPRALAEEVAVDSNRNRKLARVRRGCKISAQGTALAAHKKQRAVARNFSTVA